MAIDHRIIQQIGVRDNAPALNIFQNALASAQNRKIQNQRAAQQAELQPFRQQLLEQQVTQGQQGIDKATDQRILKSFNDFAVINESVIDEAERSGDFSRLQELMVRRRAELQQQNLPTEQTDEAISSLAQGDIQSLEVINGLRSARELFNQQSGQVKSVSQREFDNLLRVAQDPNSTELEKNSARRKLGDLERKGVKSKEQIFAEDESLTGKVAKSKKTIAQAEAFGRATGVNRVKRIDKGFEAVTKIDKNIANLEKSIAVIKDGASSGPFVKLLPTFKSATKELEQIQGELALDVVGSVAFGALSEGELNLAKQIGLPDLPPEKLKDWAIRKIKAQKKVKAEMLRQIQHLDEGGSIASYFRMRTKEFEDKKKQEGRGKGEIMTDANGNRARVFADGTFEELP